MLEKLKKNKDKIIEYLFGLTGIGFLLLLFRTISDLGPFFIIDNPSLFFVYLVGCIFCMHYSGHFNGRSHEKREPKMFSERYNLFVKWLKTEEKGIWKIIKFSAAIWTIMNLLAISFGGLFIYYNIPHSENVGLTGDEMAMELEKIPEGNLKEINIDIVKIETRNLILGAFAEELVFRIIPFVIIFWYFNSLKSLVIGGVIVSMIFGYAHGDWNNLINPNILLQGFAGIGLFLIYLRCGGFHKKMLKPAFITTLVHFSNNFLLALSPMAMKFIFG